jgi:hypothetical protein
MAHGRSQRLGQAGEVDKDLGHDLGLVGLVTALLLDRDLERLGSSYATLNALSDKMIVKLLGVRRYVSTDCWGQEMR